MTTLNDNGYQFYKDTETEMNTRIRAEWKAEYGSIPVAIVSISSLENSKQLVGTIEILSISSVAKLKAREILGLPN